MTRAEATVRGYLGESVVDDILVVHWPRPSLLARVRAGYALRHDPPFGSSAPAGCSCATTRWTGWPRSWGAG